MQNTPNHPWWNNKKNTLKILVQNCTWFLQVWAHKPGGLWGEQRSIAGEWIHTTLPNYLKEVTLTVKFHTCHMCGNRDGPWNWWLMWCETCTRTQHGIEMNESCAWHLISRWGFRLELVLSFRGANERLLNRCPTWGGWDNFTFGALSVIYPTFFHLSCSDTPFWSPTSPLYMQYIRTPRYRGEKALSVIITHRLTLGVWFSG